jgi:hypothetical protein
MEDIGQKISENGRNSYSEKRTWRAEDVTGAREIFGTKWSMVQG